MTPTDQQRGRKHVLDLLRLNQSMGRAERLRIVTGALAACIANDVADAVEPSRMQVEAYRVARDMSDRRLARVIDRNAAVFRSGVAA